MSFILFMVFLKAPAAVIKKLLENLSICKTEKVPDLVAAAKAWKHNILIHLTIKNHEVGKDFSGP